MIIVVVLLLVDFLVIKWIYDYFKSDFVVMVIIILIMLFFGVEQGVVVGVSLFVVFYFYCNSCLYMVVVGVVFGSEYFCNVDWYKVVIGERVLLLCVDESLFFVNSRYLEDKIYVLVVDCLEIDYVVLMCLVVNEIDVSVLESFEEINYWFLDFGVIFYLFEVKGLVMDWFKLMDFFKYLMGKVFFSQYDVFVVFDLFIVYVVELYMLKKLVCFEVWVGLEI